MMWLFVLAAIALALTLAIRGAVRGFASAVTDPEQLFGRTIPIDVDAFRNLLRPEDDEYLRAHLPAYSFLRVRRSRFLAAYEYVRMIARNSAILVRLGQAARASSDAQVSQAAQQLIHLAIETRVYAFLAEAQLLIASFLPWWRPSLGAIVLVYPSTCSAVDRVIRLQRPELAGRVNAALRA
ncbi:MAG: hypothetical protein ACXVZJ_01735 [Terriglobales bacterium]